MLKIFKGFKNIYLKNIFRIFLSFKKVSKNINE
jgi:hypothetical protein